MDSYVHAFAHNKMLQQGIIINQVCQSAGFAAGSPPEQGASVVQLRLPGARLAVYVVQRADLCAPKGDGLLNQRGQSSYPKRIMIATCPRCRAPASVGGRVSVRLKQQRRRDHAVSRALFMARSMLRTLKYTIDIPVEATPKAKAERVRTCTTRPHLEPSACC